MLVNNYNWQWLEKYFDRTNWIPAFAGMTNNCVNETGGINIFFIWRGLWKKS